jgi:pectate lyase
MWYVFLAIISITSFLFDANNGNKNESISFDQQGFGAKTVGGTNGENLYVTSLEDEDKAGTLRWAVNQKGARIIRFKVDGTIQLKKALTIKNPNITIDGSDALKNGGVGITIRDYPINVRTNEVILRFLRIRLGDYAVRKRVHQNNWKRHKGSGDLDCLNIHNSNNVLIDHVSMSWSCDEIVSVTNSTNVTVQWSIMAEPLSNPLLHPYGDNHAYCSNNSASTITYHHCLFAHYIIRGPQFEANDILPEQLSNPKFEAINNVCYAFTKSGMRYKSAFDFPEKYKGKNVNVKYQFIANTFVNTANPFKTEIECVDDYGFNRPIYVYFKDNKGYNNSIETEDQLSLIYTDGKAHYPIKHEKNSKYLEQISDTLLFHPETPVAVEKNDVAYKNVIKFAGCYLARDKHDQRIINDIRNKSIPRIITSQEEVGAWKSFVTD